MLPVLGEGSVQILVDLKIQMKLKLHSTGNRALISPHQERGIRIFVRLTFISKDSFPFLLTQSIFIKIMVMFMIKFIKT